MRILFILDSVENPTSANVLMAQRLAGVLCAAGHTVHLLELWDGLHPQPELPGCTVHCLAFADERLMNAALACKDPVLVIEHVDLYNGTGTAPVDDLDYIIPVGKAAVRRSGQAVTVLTYLSMVQHTLEAVEQTGIDAEVVDLRWLDRASLDWDTIEASIKKTNNVLIVEQGARGTSYGGWLADEIQRRCFDWLDQPVQRVTGAEASPSISKVLERAAAARTEEVVQGLQQVMRDQGRA